MEMNSEKSKLTRKDWLDYLNNLNNREISKQNATGFNAWALFGLLGFSLFKTIDNLPVIFENFKVSILCIASVFNLLVVIIIFYFFIIIPSYNSRKRKIHTKIMILNFNFILKAIYILSIIALFSNIFIVAEVKYYGLSLILPYLLFSLFIISFNVFILINKIYNKNKIDEKMPKIDSGFIYNRNSINSDKHLFLLSSFSYMFLIYEVLQNYNILNYLNVFKSVIYLFLLIGSIIFLINNWINQMKYRWLENLEKSIITRNLNEKEIIEIFMDEYIGKDVVQWLKKIGEEDCKLVNKIKKISRELLKEMNGLDKNENNLNKRILEAEDLLKKVIKTGESIQKIYNRLADKIIKDNQEILNFLKHGPISNEEEMVFREIYSNREKDRKYITDIVKKIEKRIDEFKKYVKETKKLADKQDKIKT
ncbi:MAG: hypothetical protein ACOWWR_09740 [Eubacteriales bacterium]